MRKSDLRTGMAVFVREHGWHYVLLNVDTWGSSSREKDVLVHHKGHAMWISLRKYGEDLRYHGIKNDLWTEEDDRGFDIMEVRVAPFVVELFKLGEYKTIWKREE
ncbi:MAG: hypothetical protein IKO94_08810 [Selenomonadaceae bacterium]|nr:hypothetical protein [Selenomonadaceae bacterium]